MGTLESSSKRNKQGVWNKQGWEGGGKNFNSWVGVEEILFDTLKSNTKKLK